nr:sm-like protein LSM1B [Ipomoea batatas]
MESESLYTLTSSILLMASFMSIRLIRSFSVQAAPICTSFSICGSEFVAIAISGSITSSSLLFAMACLTHCTTSVPPFWLLRRMLLDLRFPCGTSSAANSLCRNPIPLATPLMIFSRVGQFSSAWDNPRSPECLQKNIQQAAFGHVLRDDQLFLFPVMVCQWCQDVWVFNLPKLSNLCIKGIFGDLRVDFSEPLNHNRNPIPHHSLGVHFENAGEAEAAEAEPGDVLTMALNAKPSVWLFAGIGAALPANVVLEGVCERVIVGNLYSDIPLGLYIVRGENVVLIGELGSSEEELPQHMIHVSVTEIRRAQRAEKEAADLKGSMRRRMEFLDFD